MNNEEYIGKFKQQSGDDEVIVEILYNEDGTNSDCDLDKQLRKNEEELTKINNKIDHLTNNATNLDYVVAAASGLLCGIIDNYMSSLSLKNVENLGNLVKIDKENEFSDLEDEFILLDKDNNEFYIYEMNKNIMSSLVGYITGSLFGKVILFDLNEANFEIYKVKNYTKCKLSGNVIINRLYYAFLLWLNDILDFLIDPLDNAIGKFIRKKIPEPLLNTLDELVKGPLSMLDKGHRRKFFINLKKKVLEKMTFNIKVDFKVLKDVLKVFLNQTILVAFNELVVRTFYTIRCLNQDYKVKHFDDYNTLLKLSANYFLSTDRTINRMLTISSSMLTAMDFIGAGVKSKLNIKEFFLHINYAGVCRTVLAISFDAYGGVKRKDSINYRNKLIEERGRLLNAKVSVYYKDTWVEVKETEESMHAVEETLSLSVDTIREARQGFSDDVNELADELDDLKKNNKTLFDKINDILE